jgi:recombination protein RecR
MEGDTTNLHLCLLKWADIVISTIAREFVGDELEYADEVTLGRSILYLWKVFQKQLIVLINN